MLDVGVGLSALSNAKDAAAEAARQAMESMSGEATLGLAFVTDGYEARAVIDGLKATLGDLPFAGCHVPGVVAKGQVTHAGVGVLLLGGDELSFGVDARAGLRETPEAVVRAAAEAALAAMGPAERSHSVLVTLPDGISGNSTVVARALASDIGAGVRIAGGGSGDDLKFQGAWQFVQRPDGGLAVSADAMVALALKTAAPVGVALQHGCTPYGPPATVTACEGALLQELDWSPAFGEYAKMARAKGDVVNDFMTFAMVHPFGIPQGKDRYVLRSPISVDDGGQIQCCSDLPQDGVVRVMAGDRETMLGAAREAARQALEQVGNAKPVAALVTSCVSRDFVLGPGAPGPSAEAAAITEVLGDIPLFGALMFGQLGHLDGGATQFHSKSVQVVLLCTGEDG